VKRVLIRFKKIPRANEGLPEPIKPIFHLSFFRGFIDILVLFGDVFFESFCGLWL